MNLVAIVRFSLWSPADISFFTWDRKAVAPSYTDVPAGRRT
jgi:hypothetical protein